MKTFEILSFHPGRQHNFEQAFQLHQNFDKFKHLTSLYFSRSMISRVYNVSDTIGSMLEKRTSLMDRSAVDVNPLPEFCLLMKRMLGYTINNADFIKRNKAFQRWIIRRYNPPKVCIGYDTSSWYVFEQWKSRSFLILDLSVAIPQYKLTLAKEYHLPATLISNHIKGDGELYDVYAKELELADLILCGSEFVKASCISFGIDEGKLRVIPYGADLSKFDYSKKKCKLSEKIKVVFVGSVSYRKGADILLDVWQELIKRFCNIELHLFGNKQIEAPTNITNVFFHGFVNQEDLVEELRTAHISVLPTFFEGSSLAIYQSMAMGLAVVTTPNAGSIIKNKVNGLLVSYGNKVELFDTLCQLITDRNLREVLAQNALKDVKQYTWYQYGRSLSSILQDRCKDLQVCGQVELQE